MSKHEKFLELAEKRVSRALKDMELIGNLANRSNYEYSEDEAIEIIRAIDAASKTVRNKFTDALAKSKAFSLRK
jgi:hypothetical protein